MPRLVCSYCGERQKEKAATLYLAWYPAEGDRVAYSIKSCVDCLVERWKPILVTTKSASKESDTCIGCGGSLESEDSPVFLNLYLPKQDGQAFELDFDAACAARICADITDFGKRLPNRSTGVEGSQAPQPSPWDAIEL